MEPKGSRLGQSGIAPVTDNAAHGSLLVRRHFLETSFVLSDASMVVAQGRGSSALLELMTGNDEWLLKPCVYTHHLYINEGHA